MADTATAKGVAAAAAAAAAARGSSSSSNNNRPLPLSERKKGGHHHLHGNSSSSSTHHQEAQQRAAIDTLIGARLAFQEAERQMTDNALAIATAKRARQQTKMGRGVAAYQVELKRRVV